MGWSGSSSRIRWSIDLRQQGKGYLECRCKHRAHRSPGLRAHLCVVGDSWSAAINHTHSVVTHNPPCSRVLRLFGRILVDGFSSSRARGRPGAPRTTTGLCYTSGRSCMRRIEKISIDERARRIKDAINSKNFVYTKKIFRSASGAWPSG